MAIEAPKENADTEKEIAAIVEKTTGKKVKGVSIDRRKEGVFVETSLYDPDKGKEIKIKLRVNPANDEVLERWWSCADDSGKEKIIRYEDLESVKAARDDAKNAELAFLGHLGKDN